MSDPYATRYCDRRKAETTARLREEVEFMDFGRCREADIDWLLEAALEEELAVDPMFASHLP